MPYSQFLGGMVIYPTVVTALLLFGFVNAFSGCSVHDCRNGLISHEEI